MKINTDQVPKYKENASKPKTKLTKLKTKLREFENITYYIY